MAVTCKICWLYLHDPEYNLAMGGDGKTAPAIAPWKPPPPNTPVLTAESRRQPDPGAYGLGDLVEQALTTLGITSDRVSDWLGRPCGCKERRDKLNAVGAWAKRVLSGGKDKAEEYLNRIIGGEQQ